MPTTRTLLKTGDGNATAALVAGTVTNVAVVTLPSDPGYEYDVSISVMFKAVGSTFSATALIGGKALSCYLSSAASSYVTGAPSSGVGNMSAANTSNDVLNSTVKYGPGAAVTVPILAAAADTYYLHYSYIGRKTITESF